MPNNPGYQLISLALIKADGTRKSVSDSQFGGKRGVGEELMAKYPLLKFCVPFVISFFEQKEDVMR